MENDMLKEVKFTSVISTPRKGLVSDYRMEDTLDAKKKKKEINLPLYVAVDKLFIQIHK